MSLEPSVETNNKLLKALRPETYERLRPHLEHACLLRGEVINEINSPVDQLYFVNRGLVSIVKSMRDGRMVEVGAIGIEGVTAPTALLGGDRAALETVVQIAGNAFRIKRSILLEEMSQDPGLQAFIQAYARLAIGQLVHTSACNALHTLDQRCCRWLLIAHDNAMSDSFALTHELIAMMLGVQRAGVSIMLGKLKKAGLVKYQHGRMTIADRQGLESMACECYGDAQADLARLFQLH